MVVVYYISLVLTILFGLMSIACYGGTIKIFREYEAIWCREFDTAQEFTIFLSYKHSDFSRAKAIADGFTQAGYKVEMSDPKALFDQPIVEIAKRIHGVSAVVVISSKENSEWVKSEKLFAESNKLPVFEVNKIEDVEILLPKLREVKREAIGFFDADHRVDNLKKSFSTVTNKKEYRLNLYAEAQEAKDFHSMAAIVSLMVTCIFFFLAIFTYLIRPK